MWDTAKWLAMPAKQRRQPRLARARGGRRVIWGHFYPTGTTWGCQPGHKPLVPYPTAMGQHSSQQSCKGLLWLFPPPGPLFMLFCWHFTLLFPCKLPLSFIFFFLSGLRGQSSPSDFVVSWGLLVFWKLDRCVSGCSVGTRTLFNLN